MSSTEVEVAEGRRVKEETDKTSSNKWRLRNRKQRILIIAEIGFRSGWRVRSVRNMREDGEPPSISL